MKKNQSAANHVDFINFVFGLFNRNFDYIVSFTGDNCNVNKKLSEFFQTPIVGCASHELNQSLVGKVRGIMQSLRILFHL